jgi:hypothetical protein
VLLLLIACVQTPDAPIPLAVTAGADVVAYVGEPVTLPGTVEGAARQEWSFGDGATSADPTHSYAAPGHYTAVLSAWDAAGRDLTDALRVTVVHPPLDAAPRSSTTALSDAGRVLAVLPDHGLVAVAGPGGVHHLAPCARPVRLSAAAGLLAVVCADEAPAVVTYELLTLHERARLDLTGAGQEPLAVVVTDEGEVLVTLRQRAADAGLVWRLDADLQEREEHTLGRDLRGLAVQGRAALLADLLREPRPAHEPHGYLSCASCHLDGEGDNLVWDFTQRGEGLRNTIPLRSRRRRARAHALERQLRRGAGLRARHPRGAGWSRLRGRPGLPRRRP